MIIYVDVDGTICSQQKTDYNLAEPILENILAINKLFDAGHTIVYWTARGTVSNYDWSMITAAQLVRWGCKYSRIEDKNKPSFDLLIDDKAINIKALDSFFK